MKTLLAIAALACCGTAAAAADAAPESAIWPSLKQQFFGEQEILPGQGVVSLEAPYRAEDAAIVPISIHDELPPGGDRHIEKLWLFIDNNPVPMSAVFEFGPAAVGASLATRVRVQSYTHMRAVAKTSDGKLYMATEFVKASGGCSAPAAKDPGADTKLGQIRLRELAGDDGPGNRVQMLIRHPNHTGLQMNQVTRLVVPPHYVNLIDVETDGVGVLHGEMTFSLSQNPSLRFTYRGDGLRVKIHDTENNWFTEKTIPGGGS